MSATAIIAADAPSANLSFIGPALHDLLIAKGWELQYANADAIGTGTATSPKFDKTPATNTSGGRVTYLMPLAGQVNRWTVDIEFRWAGQTSAGVIRTTTAKGVNTVTGVLVEPGRQNGGRVVNTGNNAVEGWMTASEYGFAIGSGANWHGVERRRTTGNVVTDDLITHQFAVFDTTGFASGARNVTRNWATVEYAEQPLAFLAGFSAATTLSPISTLSSSDGNVGYPTGPISTSNGLGGVLRHVQTWRSGDCVIGTDQSIEIGGESRLYFTTNTTSGPDSSRVLIARE